jgi:ribosome biogenesis ATPase
MLFLSGADLAALVREASVSALREHLSTNGTDKCITVHQRHFEKALEKVRPSVSAKVCVQAIEI